MKRSISIIISAYKAQEFIEECLDSIEKQTYFKDFNDYEILLGFDGCKDTLNKVMSIKDKYKNLRLFWFEENNGPYLVFNTLISKSKYDILVTFGADDIMYDFFIEKNINMLTNNRIIRTKCSNFKHPYKNKITHIYNVDGVVFFNKHEFNYINGFQNWRCGSDSDLISRLNMNNVIRIHNDVSTFLRRVHDKSLTNIEGFKYGSEYRKSRQSLINQGVKLKKIINDKFEIYEKVIEI